MTRILPNDRDNGFATRSVHAGQIIEPLAGAVMMPIYQTSTYVQQGLGKHRGYEYARTQNPTREALERNVASLEGATHGFAFGSGLAALDAVLKLLKSGDHIVCGENVYGGSHRLMERIYGNFGLQASFVDMRDMGNIERAITPATRLIYCETPTNPMMNLTDLAGVGDLAQAHGYLYVVDNTFATPYFQRPLEHGADIVLHSTTKYLNGHSNMVGGLSRRSGRTAGVHSERRRRGARPDGLLARASGDQDTSPEDAAARSQRSSRGGVVDASAQRDQGLLSWPALSSSA
jgi:cystathionine gamma-lyase